MSYVRVNSNIFYMVVYEYVGTLLWRNWRDMIMIYIYGMVQRSMF